MRRALTSLAFALIVVSASCGSQSVREFADAALAAYKAGDFERLGKMFAPGQAPDWIESKGLTGWNAAVMPAAPGYGDAEAWLVLSRHTGPESDRDRIHPIVRQGAGWALAAELDEGVETGYTIATHTFDMRIAPEMQIVNVTDTFRPEGKGEALLLRLSPDFRVTRATAGEKDIPVVNCPNGVTLNDALPEGPALVRFGSVFWIRGDVAGKDVTLRYGGKVAYRGERAGPDAAFMSAYWWPHMGRRPIKHQITMRVPSDWIAIGQGEMVSENRSDAEYTVIWRNDLAVPFLTVAAGPFVLAAETTDRGRTFRSYMMPDNVEKDRAAQIVDDCKRAVAFFEDRLVKFPYTHYYVIDSPNYYGLEAYSFTILTPRITTWAPTHEIGHTYFGGMAPNSYRGSIWNESFTQYIDSALFKNNSDHTLDNGFGANQHGDPLAKIAGVNHRSSGEGYMRGAYVMHMLEREIGLDVMLRCLRKFCEERRGKLSDWPDFQAVVRKETGGKYDWFFDQWVYSGKHPALEIASVEPTGGGWNVTVRQDTDPPYRLRFEIVVEGEGGETATPVEMTKARESFRVSYDAGGKPATIRLRTRGITHATPGKAVSL